MRKLIVLGLLAVPSLTLSQEFPKVTKVGQKAANTLLTAFVKAGGLKVETDRKTKQRLMVVADSKKLRELVKQRRNDFTPAVRDALLRRFAHPGVVAVLLVAGEEKGDEQAMAFGHLFAADIAEEQLRYREARQDYERASKLFEGLKMAAWQATVLSNLATVCQAQRDLSEAHTFCQKALQLRREIHGERHPNVAGSLNNLASICKDQGDLAQARKFAQQALDLSKQLHGERHPLVATSLNNLAMIRAAQGDLAQARKLCQQALDLRRQIHGERHPHVAASLHNLAGVCRAQGDLAQARTLSEQALALRRQIHGERHPDVAGSLANLAMVCRAQGNLAQARTLCQQALDLRRQLHGERHAAVATALDNLALICRAQGDLAQARTLHQQALELTRQIHGERHPNIAASLNNLGSVCHEQGDLPQARKLHQQALGLLKQIHGARHRNIAASLSNLAMVCKDQGDLAQARKFSQQALELAMQIHTERHPDVANALNGLALVCYDQGDLPRARKFAQQALDMYKQLHGARHPAVATSLNNLALVCYDQGDLPQARKLHQQALELYKELHGERHPHVANSLHNLAVVCRVQGNLPSAVRFLTEAVLASRLPGIAPENMAALRPQDFTCDANTVGRLHDLGLTIQLSGKRDDASAARQAATAYALAADLLDRLRADVLESEEGKLFQGAKRAAVVPARVALAATLFALDGKAADLHVALTALEQGRARVFLQALAQARSRQLGGVSGTLLDQERDLLGHLRGIDARIRKENAKTLDQRNADLVKQLYDQRQQKETQLNQLVQRMRQEHPQYAALQYPQPCSLHQARDCLAANEVAVLFALDEKQSWAVVVQKTPAADDKGQGVAVVELPGTDVLGPRVRTLVDAEVLTSDSRTRRLGAELYGLLLQPLQKHIDGKDLLVVPDGVLWELPFELLVQGRTPERDGKYLIESRQVRYTPSLTVLHLVRQWEGSRKAPTEPLWALADPVFSKDDPRARGDLSRPTRDLLELYARRSGSGDGFARLPGTRREVESIARLHGARKGDVVLDTLASEKVLKTASAGGVLARKRYVHLATHGILASQLGRPPSLVLSLVCNDGAEQGGGVNDGFLSLVEVTHLKLNADLVVLSACATGRGDLRPGEGVVGLSRAFLYAGSRGVVCSLWQVDDARTARLMQALYAELKKGTPSREALTAARRSLIAAEEAPLFWAPFILIGQ